MYLHYVFLFSDTCFVFFIIVRNFLEFYPPVLFNLHMGIWNCILCEL